MICGLHRRTSLQTPAWRFVSNVGAGTFSLWGFFKALSTTRHWDMSMVESSKKLYSNTWGPMDERQIHKHTTSTHVVELETLALVQSPFLK